ncbi:hypothetical protein V8D89_005771 [Ganoderma adspersum]
MFTKSTLVKFVLAPIAAVTLLAPAASASPTAVALKVREGDGGFAVRSSHWPRWSGGDGDGDCRPDRDRLPKIVKPNRDTVWRVGDGQQVVWEKKRPWDDWKDGKDDDKDKDKDKDKKDGKDDKGKDGKDDKDKKGGNDHRKPRCKTKLTLRKGHGFRPVTLAENFDLDAGSVGVTVPDVPPDNDYTVTLSLGKLESTSDRFKIVKKRSDCKGWWCKDDGKDDKDDHRDDKDRHRDDKDNKDGKGRHDDKDCKDWWCKDHGKDGKDHHDDKDRKDGKDHDGKDGKGRDGKDGKHGHDDNRGKDGKENHSKDDNKHY